MNIIRHDIHPFIKVNLALRSSIPFEPPLIRSVIVEISSRSASSFSPLLVQYLQATSKPILGIATSSG